MIALIRDDVFWNNLRTKVRLFDPIIETLCALEADNAFVSAVYQRFRWLWYNTVCGVTSPEPEPELSESENESDESDSDEIESTQWQALNDIGVLSDVAAIATPAAPVGNGVAFGGLHKPIVHTQISPLFVLTISKASFARKFRNGGYTCTQTQWR
ncbi:unnamed protein product [Phytophthora fragariaefolia]|uniref:Unnamed protein product n=1 Tax=Phytophthora fragariaefolia TaxID=1490495 RepID=A0A9W6YAS7_9STRA|nr:unnamed protein product [Phytophthora fragariaefolia]